MCVLRICITLFTACFDVFHMHNLFHYIESSPDLIRLQVFANYEMNYESLRNLFFFTNLFVFQICVRGTYVINAAYLITMI